MNKFTVEQKNEIGKTLEKLYNLKGIFHTKEQVKDMAVYFSNSNYSFNQIIAGIERLEKEQLDVIDNIRVEESIKALIKITSINYYGKCEICENGLVVIRGIHDILDAKIRRCNCELGQKKVGNNIKLYQGSENGKTYKVLTNKDMTGFNTIKPEWFTS